MPFRGLLSRSSLLLCDGRACLLGRKQDRSVRVVSALDFIGGQWFGKWTPGGDALELLLDESAEEGGCGHQRGRFQGRQLLLHFGCHSHVQNGVENVSCVSHTIPHNVLLV